MNTNAVWLILFLTLSAFLFGALPHHPKQKSRVDWSSHLDVDGVWLGMTMTDVVHLWGQPNISSPIKMRNSHIDGYYLFRPDRQAQLDKGHRVIEVSGEQLRQNGQVLVSMRATKDVVFSVLGKPD